MASPSRKFSRVRSHLLDDLDLKPVREVRERVLNDVTHNPVVPSPGVKFSFVDVDVSFPRQSKVSVRPGSVQKNIEKITDSKRKRNDHDNEQKENRGLTKESKVYDKENKFSKMAHSYQRSMEDERRAFLSQLLRRGVPVWEEVPEEEQSTKCIGKIFTAVWEDVQHGSMNSYSVNQGEDLIGSSENSASFDEESLQVHDTAYKEISICSGQNDNASDQNVHSKPKLKSQHSSYYCQSQLQQTGVQSQLKVQKTDLHNHAWEPLSDQPVYRNEERMVEPDFSPDHNSGQGHIPDKSSVHERNISLRNPSDTHAQESHSVDQISQVIPVDVHLKIGKEFPKSDNAFVSQERLPRPVMKKKHGGRIENNDVMASISWWPGDEPNREKNIDGEEEKHEKESTKEMRCKRDLSVPSRSATEPPTRRHKITSSEEKGFKSPPRVKTYEKAEVRKYMEVKRSERLKSHKELQVQREQERIKRKERLRELAIKTKQLAQTCRKTENNELPFALEKNNMQIHPKAAPNWNCTEDCWHEAHLENPSTEKDLLFDDKAVRAPPCKTENYHRAHEVITKLDIQETKKHICYNSVEKVEASRENAAKKRRKKDKKRKNKQKSISDSDSISDIVSRTVEECERRVRSSSVSLDSLSLSSVSCNSSDNESKSSDTPSAVSSLELAPNQRIISLSQMAQKLSSQITEEEENLRQCLINERGKVSINASLSQAIQPTGSREETSKHAKWLAMVKDRGDGGSSSRVPLPYSQIEALSVEELIAKMKTMLPNASATQEGSSVMTNTNQGDSKSIKEKEILKDANYALQENKKKTLLQKKDQSSMVKLFEPSGKELPKLIPPDIPMLQLSGGSSIRIATEMGFTYPEAEDLSSLPGYNVGQNIDNQQVQQGNIYRLPLQTSEHCFIASPLQSRKLDQDQSTNLCVPAKENEMEKAALLIQAAYRGYRVRKITCTLLKKQPLRLIKKVNAFQQTKSLQNNTNFLALGGNKLFKSSYFSRTLSDLDQEKGSSIEGESEQIDWQKIRTELEERKFKLRNDSQYIFKRSDLPEWIKPYYVLSETGNVENFIESKVKELEVQNWNTAHEKGNDILNDHRIERHGKSKDNSSKKDLSCLEKTHFDVTLTEGPLSDLEEIQDVSVHEKETQTNFTNNNHSMTVRENINKEKKTTFGEGLVNENRLEFIDLRKKFIGKKILALQASNVLDGECNISQEETDSKAITFNCKAENSSDDILLQEEQHGKLEETLEEGLLEEVEQNFTQESKNHVVDTCSTSHEPTSEEKHMVESSSSVESSNVSESIKVEEISAPHKLLGKGPHFAPASLRLRLNAELMYQDSIGEALKQLHNVEQLDVLTRSRQEAFALSQSLAVQQQKREVDAQQKIYEESKKKEVDRKRKEVKKRKKEQEKEIKEEFKKHDVLWSVERMEREARNRFIQLEKEVRARAEQVLSNATQKVPESSNNQKDVIAAAAVAAVGATISQWEQLRPVQRASGASLRSQSLMALNERLISSSILGSQQYTSSFTESSSARSRSHDSSSNKKYLPCSEKLSETNLKSSYREELPSSVHSSLSISVEEQIDSEMESGGISLTENVLTGKSNNPTLISESNEVNLSHLIVKEDLSLANSSVLSEDIKNDHAEDIRSLQSVSGAVSTINSLMKNEMSQIEAVSESRLESGKEMSECPPVSEDLESKSLSEAVNEEKSQSDTVSLLSSSVKSGAILLSKAEESIPIAPSSVSVNSIKQHYMSQNSSAQGKELFESQKNNTQTSANTVTTFSSKLRKTARQEENETVDSYSESFEVESGSDGSSTSSTSQLQGQSQRDLTLVVSSGNILNHFGYKSVSQVGSGLTGAVTDGGSALGMTLNLVESLQKEEEVRIKHQEALLKLQEQSLIEEARWKLAALQSEGGLGLRKRQRAVLLQLREQRAHLKRLIETQNIAAQQRRLMLLQHHHLLATTTNMLGTSGRGYINNSRGRSPSPGSPQLTPRMMEVGITSSSDAQDDISPHLSAKGRDTGSSSPSDGGGREKRRSHSEERKRIASMRIQEKRRAAESEALLQQLLHEDREILRLKSKSPFESHEKDFVKSKRKGEFLNKRSRDKRDKSPTSLSSQSVYVFSNRTSAEGSVPEESISDKMLDSQSFLPEGRGSEPISQSDLASSVSEHEGSSYGNFHAVTSVLLEISDSKMSAPPEEVSSEGQISSPQSSSKTVVDDVKESCSMTVQGSHTDRGCRITDKSSSIKTLFSDERTLQSSGCQSGIKLSDKASEGVEKSSSVISDIVEKMSESIKSPVGMKSGSVGSVNLTLTKSELLPEEVSGHLKMRTTSGSSKSGSELTSGSETRSSSIRSEVRSSSQKISSGKAFPLPLRVPLSPRSPHRQHRRYSSESDDSFTLSQTETASDISDGEGKLLALKEQLAFRRAEAERLKKEKRRLRRERLASQERALRQQISTYDAYIQQAKMELEKESRELQQAVMVKPVIKKPQVAETKKSKLSESVMTSPEKSDVSDFSLVSEDCRSGQSLVKSQIKVEESDSSKLKTPESVLESQVSQSGRVFRKELDTVSFLKNKELNQCIEECSSEKKSFREEFLPQEEDESPKTSQTLSEEYSFEGESISEHSVETPLKKSLSQDSSFDTDHSPSQASSTETIVHSPQKVDSSQKDGDDTNSAEMSSLQPQQDAVDQSRDASVKSNEMKVVEDSNLFLLHTEGERKLEIFLPVPDVKALTVEEFTEQNRDTSAEQSIVEEIAEERIEEIATEEDSLEALGINNSSHHSFSHSKQEEESNSSHSLCQYTDKEASVEPESSLHANASFPGYSHNGSHSLCLSAVKVSQQTGPSNHAVNSLSSSLQHNNQSSCHFDDTDVFLKPKSSACAADNLLSLTERLDFAEHLKNEGKGKKSHSLDRQKLVDDISNNLLSSIMKDTTQLFRDILKDKDCVSRKCQCDINDGKPSTSPSDPSQIPEGIEKNEISKTIQLHQELKELSKINEKLAFLKKDDSKETEELNDISESSSSNKSQILKRVNELIGEDGSSPCSLSQASPRPMDMHLTPQMTFDLSPDTHSPVSPAPASPSRMLEDVEMEQVIETVIPGAAVPSESKEDSEDQALSPSHDINKASDYSLDMMALTSKLLNLAAASDLDLDAKLEQLEADNTEFSVEGIEGDWFDDDFWTSADNRKKQQQLKAEEERIAAEIARLEELQHLQEKYPDLVIREVPNKPPPPYTPPPSSSSLSSSSSSSSSSPPTRPPAYGSLQNDHVTSKLEPISPADTASASHRLSKADQRKLAAESFCGVPNSQKEVMHIISDAFTHLYEAWERGLDPSTIEPLHKLLESPASNSLGIENTKLDEEASTRIFHLLLFCLTRELVSKVYQLQHAPLPPPWVKQPYPPTRMLFILHTKSKAALYSYVEDQSKVLFGWKPSSEKESLMVRWAWKYRDLVDQILVKEVQAEESSWTHYDEDEAAVKAQVASEILDTLIAETVTLVVSILARKITYVTGQGA
ncbi:uncharacterized protein [Panulirus ornatus]|uniref:uncharacterized protein isoform X2 n=1 Tax=Panulirus ornatus TaxID=150431 RepID=UPI003A847D4A